MVTPTWSHDHVSLSGCVRLAAWHVLADWLALQAHLPDATADSTYFSTNQAHVQCQIGTGGSTVEKPAETQTSIRLAIHLVRAPNSRSGGHEVESSMWQKLGALNKSGKTLGVRSFCSGDSDMITWSCQSVWLRNTRSSARHWQTHLSGGLPLPDTTADSSSWLKSSPCEVPKQNWVCGDLLLRLFNNLRNKFLVQRKGPEGLTEA